MWLVTARRKIPILLQQEEYSSEPLVGNRGNNVKQTQSVSIIIIIQVKCQVEDLETGDTNKKLYRGKNANSGIEGNIYAIYR